MLEHEDIVLTNVARGDNASFGVLFNHYYPKVRVYLTNVLEDKHSAQDIAQDIFAKIWLLRKTLPEIRDFGSYLFVMSREENKSNMEIAEILCIKKKTVENLLNAALRQLRRSLNAILFF